MGLWSRLVRTVRRTRHDDEIDEEIAFHLAMRAEQAGSGRAARLRFGNPQKIREDVRAAGIVTWLDSIVRDLRHAGRQLRRSPAVTGAVIASLVIGIGANTAVFSLVDVALLRSLPVRDPHSLRLLQWFSADWPDQLVESLSGYINLEAGRLTASSVSPQLHRRLAREQRAAAALVGFSDSRAVSVVIDGRAEELGLQYVSSNFFQELGVIPAPGRPFREDDDRVGRPLAVVISHRLWQRRFGGDRGVLGRALHVNGLAATIVGVTPPAFFGLSVGEWVDVYAPLAAEVSLTRSPDDSAPLAERQGYWWVRQMARLPEGADPEAVLGGLQEQFQRLAVPEGVTVAPDMTPTLTMSPGRRGFDPIGNDEAHALRVLWLLVGLVLLIVCANVANLLLARAVGRQRESAVRLALGAGRGRLFRQHLIESLVLAAIGGAGGLLTGHIAARAIDQLLQRSPTGHFAVALDLRMLAFTTAVSLLAALLFGIAPGLAAVRAGIPGALKAQGRTIVQGQLWLPRVLVGGQLAMCLAVLVTAGLLGRSLATLRLSDLGFERERLFYVTTNPWRSGMDGVQVATYAMRLEVELRAIPGVLRVAAIGTRPLSGSSSHTSATFPGRPDDPDRDPA